MWNFISIFCFDFHSPDCQWSGHFFKYLYCPFLWILFLRTLPTFLLLPTLCIWIRGVSYILWHPLFLMSYVYIYQLVTSFFSLSLKFPCELYLVICLKISSLTGQKYCCWSSIYYVNFILVSLLYQILKEVWMRGVILRLKICPHFFIIFLVCVIYKMVLLKACEYMILESSRLLLFLLFFCPSPSISLLYTSKSIAITVF